MRLDEKKESKQDTAGLMKVAASNPHVDDE